jgi:hypothetical protein
VILPRIFFVPAPELCGMSENSGEGFAGFAEAFRILRFSLDFFLNITDHQRGWSVSPGDFRAPMVNVLDHGGIKRY